MNGVDESSRCTAPPQASQTVSGASEIRWRTSKTRPHLSHWYSYVGIVFEATEGGAGVSRRHGRRLIGAVTLGAVVLTGAALGGCSFGPTKLDQLRAQNTYERGVTYLSAKQPSAAMQAFQEAVTIDPKTAVYRDGLGLVLMELGRVEQAAEQFQKVVEMDELFANGWFHLGTAQAELQQWQKAVDSYRRAISLPTMTVPELAHQNLGLALFHLKRYREAESALRFAINLDPEMQAAYYNLGLLFTAEQRVDDAKAAFRRTRQLGPDTAFGQAARDRLKALGEGS